jgi:hypothetical protein
MIAALNDPAFVGRKLSEEFTRQGQRIAEQLRDAAARVELESTRLHIDHETGLPDHNVSAASILDAINSFHGNLPTYNLLTAAADADRHYRTPEAPSGR